SVTTTTTKGAAWFDKGAKFAVSDSQILGTSGVAGGLSLVRATGSSNTFSAAPTFTSCGGGPNPGPGTSPAASTPNAGPPGGPSAKVVQVSTARDGSTHWRVQLTGFTPNSKI